MHTTEFKDWQSGRVAVTYTDPYDLPMIAKMVAAHHSGVHAWKVIVSVGGSDNYVYGPVMVEFDLYTQEWTFGEGETGWHLEHGYMSVLGKGVLAGTDQSSIYTVIRKAAEAAG